MFKILKDQNATSTDLAKTYIRATEVEKTLAGEKSKVYEASMAAQVECFSAKPTKEFLSAKKKLDDISTRIEGCKFGRQQLKSRLGEVLQKEVTLRLQDITKELAAVSSEEKKLKMQYLDLCARAALVREELKGAETAYNGSVLVRLTPDPKFNFQLLDSEDQAFYLKKVEHYHQEMQVGDFLGTIVGKQSALVEEKAKLEESLQGEPAEEAQRLLDKLIPLAHGPAEVAESPKSHPSYESKAFTQDYGEGQGPNYEDGEPLPYKGVGEVLAERKTNS